MVIMARNGMVGQERGQGPTGEKRPSTALVPGDRATRASASSLLELCSP